MTARDFDPLRLDMKAFAQHAGQLQGQWPVAAFERLAQVVPPGPAADTLHQVAWRARGELRAVRSGPPQVWLHLDAQARVQLQCQRCLGPVGEDIAIDRHFLFAPDDATAEKMDADLEDDVLVLARAMSLQDLVEDELLLALPIVPRHGLCPDPLPMTSESPQTSEPVPNPFAALATLKRGGNPRS